MDKKYTKKSIVIFVLATSIGFLFGLEVTERAAMSLVAFFSVVYSFYILSTSILFGSNYSKEMYQKIDKKNRRRGIDYIKNYLRWFGRFCIFSVAAIVVFALLESKTLSFLKMMDIKIISFLLSCVIDPILFGISAVNVYFMTLMLKFITNAMVEESKLNKD